METVLKNRIKSIGLIRAAWRLFLKIKREIRNLIRQLYFSYLLNYWLSLLLYRLFRPGSKSAGAFPHGNRMKIAQVGSKKHFNPLDDKKDQLYAFSSAANISRNIYQSLSAVGKIRYVDSYNLEETLPEADIIIGTVCKNFIRLCKKNPDAKKILFLVNSHPLYRARAILHESSALKKPIPRAEWTDPFLFLKSAQYADLFILIGNDFVKNTYLQYNFRPDQIKLINSGVNFDTLIPAENQRPEGKIRIVFPASDLGIRKGLFRIINFWKEADEIFGHDKIELIIMGGGAAFKKEIDDFTKRYDNVQYLGWIDSTDSKYAQVLQSSHIVINLSIEEGQVGCVLEAMACGCVPIITEQSGVAIQDNREGYTVRDPANVSDIIEYVKSIASGKNNEMSANSRLFVQKYHNWDEFKKNIQYLVTGGQS